MTLSKVDYEALTAPFLFKLGDTLSSYIEANTDVMANLKPFEYENSSSEDESEQEDQSQEDPREEQKVGLQAEQIDTSKPTVEEVPYGGAEKATSEAGGEEAPAEDLEQNALDYLSLSLQLVRDFSLAPGVLENERAPRRKLFLFLEIDSLLRRAELGKKVSAFESAIEDFLEVIKLCEEFPEKNEAVLASACLSTGECFMNIQKPTHALVYFSKSRDLLRQDLIGQLKAQGKDFGAQEIEMSELLLPSIFDNDKIKVVKANLEEIQVYIDEIENTADRELFEKLRKEM